MLKNWLAKITDSGAGATPTLSHLVASRPPVARPKAPLVPFAELEAMGRAIAASGMFGLKDEAQAVSLMLLCQAEGLHPALAVRRYHIIENKPSFRADALQGEFEVTGAILWHERNDKECSATFWKDRRQANAAAIERAKKRYQRLRLNADQPLADLAAIDEITIRRTIEDAMQKKVAMTWSRDDRKWVLKKNWEQSPRQMLHARCLSEGVRAIKPGLIAGIYVEDEWFDEQSDSTLATAEEKVTQATANRTGEEPAAVTAEIADVTEKNFGSVVCHIGQAGGNMRDRRVDDLHPKQLEWLQKHYGQDGKEPQWGIDEEPKDVALKTAIDIALRKLNE